MNRQIRNLNHELAGRREVDLITQGPAKVLDLAPNYDKLKLGPQDPAYIPPTPHDLWVAMCEGKPSRETISARELEDWIRSCPAAKPEGDDEREMYDWGGRRAAQLALLAIEAEPEVAGLTQTFWRAVSGHRPEVMNLGLSTTQGTWAHAAAQRIFDSYRVGN